jgi:hypothetical protein
MGNANIVMSKILFITISLHWICHRLYVVVAESDFLCKNIDYSVNDDIVKINCCPIQTKNIVKCMPQFIIAGTQKSGTTALSGTIITMVKIKMQVYDLQLINYNPIYSTQLK